MLSANKKRSSIIKPALPDPGESQRNKIQGEFYETVVPWFAVATFGCLFAIGEWIRWAMAWPLQPIVMTLIAAAIVAIAAWQIRQAVRLLPQQKEGLKGERFIGQFLQAELLPRNYFVIHDIRVGDANIDHAVIGPRGIFSVEVKTHKKPARGETRISYDGQRILINGWPPDRDPVIQARAQAKNLRDILEDQTASTVSVQPVVLYPEWYVEEPRGADVWVLNHERFIGYIEQEPVRFTDEQVRQLANGLMRHVRAQLVT
jgi:Nuclease-related domain